MIEKNDAIQTDEDERILSERRAFLKKAGKVALTAPAVTLLYSAGLTPTAALASTYTAEPDPDPWPPEPTPPPQECTSELRSCPGGSQVAQDPANNCQYCPCPTPGVPTLPCPANGGGTQQ